MTNDTTPQATLEKVRELTKRIKKHDHDSVRGKPTDEEGWEIIEDMDNAFPSIASLVESQAKRIEELEKALQEEKDMDCPECGYGISI